MKSNSYPLTQSERAEIALILGADFGKSPEGAEKLIGLVAALHDRLRAGLKNTIRDKALTGQANFETTIDDTRRMFGQEAGQTLETVFFVMEAVLIAQGEVPTHRRLADLYEELVIAAQESNRLSALQLEGEAEDPNQELGAARLRRDSAFWSLKRAAENNLPIVLRQLATPDRKTLIGMTVQERLDWLKEQIDETYRKLGSLYWGFFARKVLPDDKRALRRLHEVHQYLKGHRARTDERLKYFAELGEIVKSLNRGLFRNGDLEKIREIMATEEELGTLKHEREHFSDALSAMSQLRSSVRLIDEAVSADTRMAELGRAITQQTNDGKKAKSSHARGLTTPWQATCHFIARIAREKAISADEPKAAELRRSVAVYEKAGGGK